MEEPSLKELAAVAGLAALKRAKRAMERGRLDEAIIELKDALHYLEDGGLEKEAEAIRNSIADLESVVKTKEMRGAK